MSWVWANLDRILELALVHLALSVPAVVLSLVVSVPLGWLAWRYRWSRGLLLTLCGILYAIPSLPLFIALPAIIGTGLRSPVNVVAAMTLYGIALLVRSSADGFAGVDGDVLRSATGVGFSAWGRFWRVELPLAGPVILAGLRVVVVSTVSLLTVSAVIGVQSLGSLFTDGFQRGITAEIWTGIVMTLLLAGVLDVAVVLLGRAVLPWSRLAGPRRRERRARREAVIAA